MFQVLPFLKEVRGPSPNETPKRLFQRTLWGSLRSKIRVRQRSGEGVVRRNGCPKGCFWRVRFFSAPLRFALKKNRKVLKTLREQRRNGLSKNTLLDNRFSARPLHRSLVPPPPPFATKTLPTRKKYFRIIFRLPFHDFDFFELILENYPIPIAFV